MLTGQTSLYSRMFISPSRSLPLGRLAQNSNPELHYESVQCEQSDEHVFKCNCVVYYIIIINRPDYKALGT